MTDARNGTGGPLRTGKGSRTRPVVLVEPDFVPMSEEEHRQAVAALADLLAAHWLKTRRGTASGASPDSPGPAVEG